ncbi:MAG: glycosyltransferase [Alphaproteobacteria bacterium]|nr:glycosyltransferase [Alphaproteobacteria bacterium]
MKKADKLIVLTAGGTGGHVYPADALANELIECGYRVVLFTDKRGLNNYKGKLGEIENKAIYSGSVVGKSLLVKIFSLFKVGIGILQAMFYLLTDRPRCVVGFGGYASFPTAVAAILLRIPLVVHEQNSVMSRTNRLLARFVVFAAQSFRKVKNTPEKVKTVLTGMPVREAMVR